MSVWCVDGHMGVPALRSGVGLMGRKILLVALIIAPVCGVSALPASASTPRPTIKSFTPTSGPVGTEVTIKGTNLAGVTKVSFNKTVAVVVSDTATKIKADVPTEPRLVTSR
jgi:hypothetical protein